MNSERITLSPLADCPWMIPVCAAWAYGLWGSQLAGRSFDRALALFAQGAQKDAVPLTFVAHRGTTPMGMASLWAHDAEARPDLTPWLASVYVHSLYRGAGIALQLVQAIEQAAARQGYKTLYLVTEDAEELYAKAGWQAVERIATPHGGGMLMEKAL